MCGITAFFSFNDQSHSQQIEKAVKQLSKRGPDNQNFIQINNCYLGHARLSIIDTSSNGNQPITDASGRFTIIFNGEFYNYQVFRDELLADGIQFKSSSDTEVLLYLFIKYGKKCLSKINGFFAFVIYDNQTQSIFAARDRMGIKPMLYAISEKGLAIASEMKALLELTENNSLDKTSLKQYLKFNYIPAPHSIFENVKKLMPGFYLEVSSNGIFKTEKYYEIDFQPNKKSIVTYENAQKELYRLLSDSVETRLVSDVPLGCFLSGGIDSSVISVLAAKNLNHLQTFSIGFKDEPFYDETHYANLVAKKIKSNHTVFSLSNNDLLEHFFEFLNYIDEPFADSSALAVYILSANTKKEVKVILSGDGADEIFAGYNKHSAAHFLRQNKLRNKLIALTHPLWNSLPKSRNDKFSNIFRQLEKLSYAASLSLENVYWELAGICREKNIDEKLKSNYLSEIQQQKYITRKSNLLKNISDSKSINDFLLTDMLMVLPNDMLTKVDLMSMANGLEVRVPFLDHRLVDFAFHLPAHFKIDGKMRKKIVQDTFRKDLPEELYNRPKKGFEVPLLKWFKNELNSFIFQDMLGEEKIKNQGIFNFEEIKKLKVELNSNNPGDSVWQIWNLIVFQNWFKNYGGKINA